MSHVPKDVVIFPECTAEHPDRWVAMNVFARTAFGVSSAVIAYLGNREGLTTPKDMPGTYLCWEIGYFSNENGLLADPSRFRRDVTEWQELRLDRHALEAKLRANCILVDDDQAYRARFQLKRNLLDHERLGNFHQQHGQHMMLNMRADPAKWWLDQKFTEDRRAVRRDNLYGAVQWCFLEEYFEQKIGHGMKVVDLGCGTGIYSNLMARHGAEVIGIDPSDDYLNVARENAQGNVTFINGAVGAVDGLHSIPDQSADLVFMSDALLFYYVPFYPGQKADMQVLLADIRRILVPGGIFVSMEPHSAFFLNPWLGEVDRPFTILTEYLHRDFGIVPPLSWLIQSFTTGGFDVGAYQEIGSAGYFKDIDPRAYYFANEFPLWQLLELKARKLTVS